MKKQKIISILTALIMLALSACSIKQPDILPDYTVEATEAPEVTEIEKWNEGETFSFAETERLFITGNISEDIGKTVSLAVRLFNASGLFSKTVSLETGKFSQRKNGDIVLMEDNSLSAEQSKTTVTARNIYIFYNPENGGNGLLYGLQELLRKFMCSESGNVLCGELNLMPDTPERTLMLDCARKCWSVQWIKNLIAEMSWTGFNTLELHLTEEQGIRADIWRDKSGNTVKDCNGNDFSFICGGTVVSWNRDYAENIDKTYSLDDIIEIIKCAEEYRIEIIPSVDFPGHSRNIIERCEAEKDLSFNYNGKIYTAKSGEKLSADGSQRSTLDISSEFARNLSYAVIQAYAEFFGRYGCKKFDIASDEVSVDDEAWSDYARQNGGETMFDGYTVYVNSLCSILNDMGYSVRANNDFLFSQKSNVGLNPELEICYWQPTDNEYGSAEYLLSESRTIYNCVVSYCYYVLRQSGSGYDARSPECGWWDFHHSTAERIYSGCNGSCGFDDCNEPDGWNPSKMWNYNSKNKTVVTGKNLGGAYFYIWGDWAEWDEENNIFYRTDNFGLVPRMWASCAKMWKWDADKGIPWNEFKAFTETVKYSPLITKP